jgi:hypothetical protein
VKIAKISLAVTNFGYSFYGKTNPSARFSQPPASGLADHAG